MVGFAEEPQEEDVEVEMESFGAEKDHDAAAVLEQAGVSRGSADFITLDKLEELKKAFELADADGGGGLDLEEFVIAFGPILGKNMSDQELTNLYMKIDANSDGTVDWGEFTEFMLLENKGAEAMAKAAPRCEYLNSELCDDYRHHVHSKAIIRTRILPDIGVCATCSEDGTVKLWQSHNGLRHIRTLKYQVGAMVLDHRSKTKKDSASQEGKKENGAMKIDRSICPIKPPTLGSSTWCNDCCYMPASKVLAVATSDRTISFFDSTMGYSLVGRIRPMINAPLLLCYFSVGGRQEIFMCADDQGYVHVWHLEPNQWFFPDTTVDVAARSLPPEGVNKYFRHRVHEERINDLQYHASIGAIVTCSSDGTVCFSDVEKGRVLRTFCCHRGAVLACAYVSNSKLMISTGIDRQILFWNPYSLAISHEIVDKDLIDSPIVSLTINAKEHQLISLSELGVARVWDLSTFMCLEKLYTSTGEDRHSFYNKLLYDSRNRQLVLSGRSVMLKQAVKQAVAARKSHEWSVVDALYNESFHQLVSAAAFEVHVWDVHNGQLTFRFTNPHGASSLTSMCFDCGGRRLITGAHSGEMKIWNFNNGACLGELTKRKNGVMLPNISDAEEDCEVTSITSFVDSVQVRNGHAVSHDYIVATGRDRRVFVFSESKKETTEYAFTFPLPQHVPQAHLDEVTAVVPCANNLVATAGDDGRILIWSTLSGVLKQRIGHSVTARRQLDTHFNENGETVKKSKSKQNGLKATQRPSAAELLLLKAKHFGESFEESAARRCRSSLGNTAGNDNDSDSDESDSNEQDDDVARIRSLVRKSTLSDLSDIKRERARRATERNLPPEKRTWRELELEKQRNTRDDPKEDDVQVNAQDVALPLSAREGSKLAEQAAELERQLEKQHKRKALRGVPKPDRMAVENLLFLDRIGCLCSSGSDGFLRFWNTDSSNMLFELDVMHPPNESLSALATNKEKNTSLFVGDTDGWVSVWDISKVRPLPDTKKDWCKVSEKTRWHAHKTGCLEKIVHINFQESGPSEPIQLLVTACTGGIIRLWTEAGSLIGMFGQELSWSLRRIFTWAHKKTKVVRKANKFLKTLDVFNGGTCAAKLQRDKIEMTEKANQVRIRTAHENSKSDFKVLKTRMKNKFKLRFLKEIEHGFHDLDDAPVSSDQALLMQLSKAKRGCRPSEMPPKANPREALQKQQVMQRVALPALQEIRGGFGRNNQPAR